MFPLSPTRLLSAAARAYVRGVPLERGKWRLLEALRDRLVSRPAPGVWIRIDPLDDLERRLWLGGRQDDAAAAYLAAALQPGMSFVDVGAHIGIMSLVAARRVGDAGRVLSFEPVPRSFARLRANVALNGLDNVDAVPAAVGARQGTTPLYVRDDDTDMSNVLYREEGAPVTETTATMVTLDAALAEAGLRPDVLKLDVEGAELEALAGAETTLAGADAPLLVIEYNPPRLALAGREPEELPRRLAELGYAPRVLEVSPTGRYVNLVAAKPAHADHPAARAAAHLPPLDEHPWRRSAAA